MKKYSTSGKDNLCLIHAIFGNEHDKDGYIISSEAVNLLKDCQGFAMNKLNVKTIEGFTKFVEEGHWNDVITFFSESLYPIKDVAIQDFELLVSYPNIIDFLDTGVKTDTNYYLNSNCKDYKNLEENEKNEQVGKIKEHIKNYTALDKTIVYRILSQASYCIGSSELCQMQPYIPLGRFIAKQYGINLKIERPASGGQNDDVDYFYNKEPSGIQTVIYYDGVGHFYKNMTEEDCKKLSSNNQTSVSLKEFKEPSKKKETTPTPITYQERQAEYLIRAEVIQLQQSMKHSSSGKNVELREALAILVAASSDIVKNLVEEKQAQQDATEFLEPLFGCLFDKNHPSIKSTIKIIPFGYRNPKAKTDACQFLKISFLEISGQQNFSAMIDNYQELETLRGGDKYLATKIIGGEKKVNATRQLNIIVPENCHELVFSVNRFKKDKLGALKIGTDVNFDSLKFNKIDYAITAFIWHNGTINEGHYTTYIKEEDDQWYHYNDEKRELVKGSKLEEAMKQAYVVKYASHKVGLPGSQLGTGNAVGGFINRCWLNASFSFVKSFTTISNTSPRNISLDAINSVRTNALANFRYSDGINNGYKYLIKPVDFNQGHVDKEGSDTRMRDELLYDFNGEGNNKNILTQIPDDLMSSIPLNHEGSLSKNEYGISSNLLIGKKGERPHGHNYDKGNNKNNPFRITKHHWKNIYLNPEHDLVSAKVLSPEQVDQFFTDHQDHKEIAKVYLKTKKFNKDKKLLAKDIELLTEWAKNIFILFKGHKTVDQRYYEEISVCGNRLIALLAVEGDTLLEDATSSTGLYITYLILCFELNEGIQLAKEGDKEKLEEELLIKFERVFSSSLGVCAGGIASALMKVLSGGLTANIVNSYSQVVKYIPFPMQAHFIPFIVNMLNEKVIDVYQANIRAYFTRKEIEELINAFNSGDFFNVFVGDVISFWKELSLSGAGSNLLSILIQDHPLFIGDEPILDSYCLYDQYYDLFKTEEEVRNAVAKRFLATGLFIINYEEDKITSQKKLSHLITLSIKSRDLFFFSKVVDAGVLDENNEINNDALQVLLKSSNGTARFKEFAQENIEFVIKEIKGDKYQIDLLRFVSNYYEKLSGKDKFSGTLSQEQLDRLIKFGTPLKNLKEIFENHCVEAKIKFSIKFLSNHPEFIEIIAYIKEERKLEVTKLTKLDFIDLIKNRKFEFLDALLDKYPGCFNELPFLDVGSPYFEQKLEYLKWLGDKMNTFDKSTEICKDLKKGITTNGFFISWAIKERKCSVLSVEVLFLMMKGASSDELLSFFLSEHHGRRPLDFLAMYGPEQFFKTIEFLKGALSKTEYLMHLIGKTGSDESMSLHYLANEPEQFFKTIKLLDGISSNNLIALLKIENKNKNRPLHYLAFKGTKHFLKTVELIPGKALKGLLEMGNNSQVTPLHLLAEKGPEHFFETVKLIPREALKGLLEMVNIDQFTPLCILAENGPEHFFETVKLIPGEALKGLLEMVNNDQFTPLCILAEKGPEHFFETVKLIPQEALKGLLEKADKNQATPLHYLVEREPEQFFKTTQFLKNILSPEELKVFLARKNKTQWTLLHILAYYGPEHFFETVQLIPREALKGLLEMVNNDQATPLHVLADKGPKYFFETVKLIPQDALKGWLEKADKNQFTPLHILAINGPEHFFKTVELIPREARKGLLEMVNNSQVTPLHLLADKGPKYFFETVELIPRDALKGLLEKADNKQLTPLHILAKKQSNQFFKTIEFLSDKNGIGAKNLMELLVMRDINQDTALNILASSEVSEQFFKTIEFMSEGNGIGANNLMELLAMSNKDRVTPLHYLAHRVPKQFFKTIQFLSNKNVFGAGKLMVLLNMVAVEQSTPLDALREKELKQFFITFQFLAGLLPQEELIALLERGNKQQWTPLHSLAIKGPEYFYKFVEFLTNTIRYKNDIKGLLERANVNQCTPLHFLARNAPGHVLGIIQLLRSLPKADLDELLEKADINNITPLGVLKESAPIQYDEIMKLLKDKNSLDKMKK